MRYALFSVLTWQLPDFALGKNDQLSTLPPQRGASARWAEVLLRTALYSLLNQLSSHEHYHRNSRSSNFRFTR